MSAFEIISSKIRKERAFKRNKVDFKVKVLTAILCSAGLSYRRVSSFVGFSYEAVRQWHIALKTTLGMPRLKCRRCIALDESKVETPWGEAYVWAAWDVDTKEVLSHECSMKRSESDAEIFLKRVLQWCKDKPLILVNGGPWHRDLLESLGLTYEQEGIKVENTSKRQVIMH